MFRIKASRFAKSVTVTATTTSTTITTCAALLALATTAPVHADTAPAPSKKPAPVASTAAQYLPAAADFIGKWKLYGAAVRAPSDLPAPATPEQTAEATARQRTLITFYRAFDYLEIREDGHFNFHQPGEQPGDACAWCGKWSFHDGSLWLDLPTAPRLDIYAPDGKMQMTYGAEVGESAMFRWQVVGWAKVR
ncbi:hypothetical protein [Cupriavidus pauculus]|uniref:Lipocalin-like domain-containing protein n=1 Tax=Cupriavidus pauculus TaxID=82633 RepID=A0A2N5C5Z7_9BURK|nr:hypothetical protein [Cupriavidus pauculus]PLP97646.1 hypothetical protein CYJ10_26185 [Cupriavidus pauculus]